MGQLIEVKVPDIGDFKDVPVIEIAVKPGDSVRAEETLLTLESDKATLDVPSPAAGVVKEVKVAVGDKVGEGSLVVVLEAAGVVAAPTPSSPSSVSAGGGGAIESSPARTGGASQAAIGGGACGGKGP